MFKTWKLFVSLFFLSCVLFLPSCDANDYVREYNDLLQEHNDLIQQYDSQLELNNTHDLEYNGLIQQYNSQLELNDTHDLEYNDLLQKHNDLIQQYNSQLEQSNKYREGAEQLVTELLLELDRYESELNQKLEGAIVPPYITMDGRKADCQFRNLENEIESWTFNVETIEGSTVTGALMREWSISELKQFGYPNLAQRFIDGEKYVKLGGRYAIDCRPYIQTAHLQTIAKDFYSRHSDDESRIKETWNMVTQLCSYAGELKETPRLPFETLSFGGGDCEDLAILTVSILKAMSPDWGVQLVYMDLENPTSYKTINHVTVFADTGEYKTFVESSGKDVMSPYDNVSGFYIDIP